LPRRCPWSDEPSTARIEGPTACLVARSAALHDMLDWATSMVGLSGLIVGNLLTRSMEYRKWRRTERHRACTQLLDAGQAAMTAAAFHQAATISTPLELESSFEKFAELLNSGPKGFILRPFTRVVTKMIVRSMNPGTNAKELNGTVAGVLSSVTARVEPPVVDFIAERLGAGKSGRLTQLREAAHSLSLAAESVELICPRNVAEAGNSLTSAALALFVEEADEAASWDERLDAYNEARRKFVQAARQDLAPNRNLRIGWRRPR
jgi:hypothetical protein